MIIRRESIMNLHSDDLEVLKRKMKNNLKHSKMKGSEKRPVPLSLQHSFFDILHDFMYRAGSRCKAWASFRRGAWEAIKNNFVKKKIDPRTRICSQ